jgi:hypothetical protein
MWGCGELYGGLLGKSEGMRLLARPRRRWEDNIEIDLQEVGWSMEGTDLTQGRDRWRAFVSAVMNIPVP